jgi:hypothetical protein
MFAVVLAMTKFFTTDGTLKESLCERHSLPSSDAIKGLRSILDHVHVISDYRSFLSAISFDHVITNPVALILLWDEALVRAQSAGYLRRYARQPPKQVQTQHPKEIEKQPPKQPPVEKEKEQELPIGYPDQQSAKNRRRRKQKQA